MALVMKVPVFLVPDEKGLERLLCQMHEEEFQES